MTKTRIATKGDIAIAAAVAAGLDIAGRTGDAYSFPRYAPGEWAKAATALLLRGWTAEQVEWTLRSKHMRWAADQADKAYGSATASDFVDFIDAAPQHYGQDAVQKHIDAEG